MPIEPEILQATYEALHPKVEAPAVEAGELELKYPCHKPRKLKTARVRSPKWFKWTVEFQVEKSWVADGFDLTNDRAHSMIAHDLQYANNSEIKARVLTTPKAVDIAKEQGYSTVRAYRKARNT